MHSSDIQQLKYNTTYIIEWWDINKGGWKHKSEVRTNEKGLLLMPEAPENKGWAYRVKEKKTKL